MTIGEAKFGTTSIREMMADPVVKAVMVSDGVTEHEILSIVRRAKAARSQAHSSSAPFRRDE